MDQPNLISTSLIPDLTLNNIDRRTIKNHPSQRESRRRFLTVAGSSLLLAGCAGPGGFMRGVGRETGYAEVEGGRLYYETAGSGDPVVMLHAFTLDTRMWDAQFAALSANYRVIAYDARGFGRSSLPSEGQPYSHIDDLDRLLSHVQIERPHLVGASMGGRFALDYAVAHPERLRSLVLIDGVVGGWDWSKEWLTSYAPVIAAAQRKDVAAAKAAWLAHPIFTNARGNEAVYTRLRRMVSDYSGWHFIHRDPAQTLDPPASERLAQLRAPTLAMVGEFDMADFHQMADRLAETAKAEKTIVPGAGHLASVEAPLALNEQLLAFLQRVA